MSLNKSILENFSEMEDTDVKKAGIVTASAFAIGATVILFSPSDSQNIQLAQSEVIVLESDAAGISTVDESLKAEQSEAVDSPNFTQIKDQEEDQEDDLAEPVAVAEEETEQEAETEVVSGTGIKVQVFNGVRVQGVGARGTTLLDEANYVTLEPGNTPNEVTDSAILYASGFEDEATELAKLLNMPAGSIDVLSTRTEPVTNLTGVDLVVVIGSDGKLDF